MKTLSYDDQVHEYKLIGDKGEESVLPSVTQIVSAVTGKDFSGIAEAVLEAARERGCAVHKDIEDRTFKTPEGKWMKPLLPDPFVSERIDYAEIDGLLYAGTCDILADEEIDDIKATAALDRLYCTLQLNLYARMYSDIKRLNVFWTPSSGSYEKVPIKMLSDAQMVEVIRAYKAGRILPANWLASDAPEAPTLDLVVYSQSPGELATNARVILETVKKQLAEYKPENYSDTNIADAKRDKAELNTAAKALNDKRLELERKFMEPFVEFKDIVTETVGLIKTASGQIDSIVKEVEQREKDAKRKIVVDYFASKKCELFNLEQIFNVSWLNKGTKIKDVEAEIDSAIEKVGSDLVILDRLGEPEAKALYLETLSLESALAAVDRIKANRERIARIEPVASAKPEEAKIPVDVPFDAPMGAPELLERTFTVRCTEEKLIALSKYMNANEIVFERVK